MNQLPLFAPPPPLDPLWIQWPIVKGETIRGLKVKSFDGSNAIVVPVNFVDEAFPWWGRPLPIEELRRDWKPWVRKPKQAT